MFPKDISSKIFYQFTNDIDEFKTNLQKTLNEYKKDIFDYICENFDEYDYNRCVMQERENFKFEDYREFLEQNYFTVQELNNDQLIRLKHLIEIINYGCHNMDKENNVAFRTSGFCFDNNKKLVIFNER